MRLFLHALACAITFAFVSTNLLAQTPPTKVWDKRYGGGRSDVQVFDVQQTSDGGYIVGGSSDSYFTFDGGDNSEESSLGLDFWIIRINADGSKVWDKMLGSCNDEIFSAIVQTADNGFLIAGSSTLDGNPVTCGRRVAPARGMNDFYIVKLNSNGEFQWDAAYGGSNDDMLSDIQPTSDGGFILGGTTVGVSNGDITSPARGGTDYLMIKIDANGIKQWDARFGGSGDDNLSSCRPADDGGFILGGVSLSPVSGDKSVANHSGVNQDEWVIKINASRVKQWDKVYGSSGTENLTDIRQTSEGGYVIAGTADAVTNGDISEPPRGGNDFWIIKINSAGTKTWDKRLGGGADDNIAGGRSIEQLSDGGYIVGGSSGSGVGGERTQPSWGGSDFWMVRTNAEGQKRWDVRFGGDNQDFQESLATTSDGAFILAGTSASGISGDHSENFVGPPTGDYWIIKTSVDPPCKINCDGETTCSGKPEKGKVKICHRGKEICVSEHAVKAHLLHGDELGGCMTVHPNPAHKNIVVNFASSIKSAGSMKLYSIFGRKVWEKNIIVNKGENSFNIQLPSLATGLYFLEVHTITETFRKKILVIH